MYLNHEQLIFPDNNGGTPMPVEDVLDILQHRQDPASRFITDLLSATALFGRREAEADAVTQFRALSPERKRDQVCRVNNFLRSTSAHYDHSGNSAKLEFTAFLNTYARWIASGTPQDMMRPTGDIMHDLYAGATYPYDQGLASFEHFLSAPPVTSMPTIVENALAALNKRMALELGKAQDKAASIREARR